MKNPMNPTRWLGAILLLSTASCGGCPGAVVLNGYLNERSRQLNASNAETERQMSEVDGKTQTVRAENMGRAEYARAQQNRRIKVLEREAELEGAKLTAQAEIERARGVAAANKIIGSSLKDNEAYLRWLWIHEVSSTDKPSVIYVPTEAGLPVLEAGKRGIGLRR